MKYVPLPPHIILPEVSNRELFRRFATLIWPYRWYMLPALICMMILAGTNGAIAIMVQPILDSIFIQQDKGLLLLMPLLVLGIFVLRGAVYYVQEYLTEFVGLRIARTMQIRLYRHLLTLDLGFLQAFSSGSFISRVLVDATMMKSSSTDIISSLFLEGLSVIILMGVLFYRDVELACISLIVLPVSGYLIYLFGCRVRRLAKRHQEMMQGVTAQLVQNFDGLRIIKAFGMERYEQAVFRKITKDVLNNSLKTAKVRSATNPSMDLVAGIAVSLVILYGGDAVIQGKTTTGNFFSFITALLLAYNPTKRLASINNTLQRSLAAARRMFELLDVQATIVNAPQAQPLSPLKESICFEGVSFAYEPAQAPVLQGIDLTIRAGQTVAIVGRSGSGKSSLVNLVPRFYDVTAGRITIDGQDLREVTLESLRNQVALVTQDVILFNDTIASNIAYGDRHYTLEQLRAAAAAANALEFIEALPDGFDTIIGDRGLRLSGGQRQRLSIARSIYKNAPILILDEATSALDTESERLVQEALERMMADRTTLVIAHRLSTIRKADLIVVLRDGRLVEAGSHEALLAQGGEYAKLHALQFQGK